MGREERLAMRQSSPDLWRRMGGTVGCAGGGRTGCWAGSGEAGCATAGSSGSGALGGGMVTAGGVVDEVSGGEED